MNSVITIDYIDRSVLYIIELYRILVNPRGIITPASDAAGRTNFFFLSKPFSNPREWTQKNH